MKLSIANRVGLALGLLLFLFFVTSVVTFLLADRIEGQVERLVRVDDAREGAALETQARVADMARTVHAYAGGRGGADADGVRRARGAFERSAATLVRLAASEGEEGLAPEVVARFDAFKGLGDEIVALTDAEDQGLGPVRSKLDQVAKVIADKLAEAGGGALGAGIGRAAALEALAAADAAFDAVEASFAARDPAAREPARQAEADFQRLVARLGQGGAATESPAWTAALVRDFRSIESAADGVQALAQRKAELLSRFEGERASIEQFLGLELVPGLRTAKGEAARNIDFSTTTIIIFLIVMSVFGVIVGSATAVSLTRGVVRPIVALKGSAEAIGRGMLDHRVAVDSEDEIGQLAATVNRIAEGRQRSEEALRELANRDPLTKLPNRILFHRRLVEAMDNGRRVNRLVAIHFLDLDNFKDINDTLGHPSGDMLLRLVAERIKGCVRITDTAARLGGDEFAIVQTNIEDYAGIPVLAKRLIDALGKPYSLDGESVYSGASIGITVYPYDGRETEQLLKNADLALYRAKQEGRNTYQVFDPEMNAEIQARKALEQDLRRALEGGQLGELFLHYQPQIEIVDGRVVGAEALVRWNHPERGMVSPGEFIPVAEQSGLITRLTEMVLRGVCVQVMAWRAAGVPPLRVSVNLSAADFKRKDLVAMVTRVLEESAVEPEFVELEITEGMVMTGAEKVIATLHELKKLGLELAIDDFGTGFSSMSYLKQFPVDRLKVDQAFVRDIPENKEDASITEAIIKLGHTFDLKVIAEGVETEEQLEFLRTLACDEVQGYFISRPLAPDAFAEFLRSHVPAEVPGVGAAAGTPEAAAGPFASPSE